MGRQRMIVILGMHRSGTSAITRGLQVLGVDLGSNLMGPAASINEKGFYEDVDFNQLNVELLTALHSDWHAFSPIPAAAFEQKHLEPFKLRAADLIRAKVKNKPFGLKDPRIARLLPFWQSVFAHTGVKASYVIAVRDPMSVAQSLRNRDGFDKEKSYYLWLWHVLPALLQTHGFQRVVVSYDLVISEPYVQLNRIARALNLPFDPHSAGMREYVDKFLDAELRHAEYHLDDLRSDRAASADVIKAYEMLARLARDEGEVDILEAEELFEQLNANLEGFSQAFDYMTRSDKRITERDGQIASLTQEVSERDRHLAERDGQIASLIQEMSERDRHLAEQDGQIASLTQEVSERDERVAELLHELQALRLSTSWRATAPLRWVVHQGKRVNHVLKIVPSAVRLSGGLRPALAKAVCIYCNHGLAGIRRGLIHVQTNGQAVPVSRSGHVGRNDYQEWIKRYDTLDDAARQRIRDRIGSFPRAPRISVVMPVYDPPLRMLDEAIRSVRNQLYPEWELCITDDASKNQAVRELLARHAAEDRRIRVAYHKQNSHISAASNTSLEMATGEFVALLDHDDLLSEQALFWVAEVIHRYPDAGVIYSDEDKISESGLRYDPYFKCDWNYDLFLSQNMISHLGVYGTELIRRIGGFREGLEGSQDYDLVLRCIEQLDPSRIIHIPRVLYHWRTHSDSTARSAEAKPYAYLAAERALNDHLARKGVAAQAERHPNIGFYRIRYSMPERSPLVTLIIPTRNSLHLIRQCLISILRRTDYPNYEILVVDNGSDDPQTLAYFDTIRSDPRLRIVQDDGPFNYSTLNNRAVQMAQGELVGLINNDIDVISGEWLTEMVSIALQPGVGAVGARLLYPDGTLQHGGVVLGLGGVAGHSHRHLPKGHNGYFARAMLQQTFSAVTAACLVVRRSIFLEVGGLEEKNLPVAFGDVDFCLRVREAGYRNVWTPYAELYHHESASRGCEDTPEKRARFAGEVRYMQERWGSLLQNDPAYSPNLTLDRDDFSYAWPPRVSRI